jgi:hypothetical protein
VITEEQRAEELARAAETCAELRGHGWLAEDAVKARYACGAIIETVATKGRPSSAWAKLVQRGGEYDDAAFFAASSDPAKARALAEPSSQDPAQRLEALGFQAAPRDTRSRRAPRR